jgi:hypothetical protein
MVAYTHPRHVAHITFSQTRLGKAITHSYRFCTATAARLWHLTTTLFMVIALCSAWCIGSVVRSVRRPMWFALATPWCIAQLEIALYLPKLNDASHTLFRVAAALIVAIVACMIVLAFTDGPKPLATNPMHAVTASPLIKMEDLPKSDEHSSGADVHHVPLTDSGYVLL